MKTKEELKALKKEVEIPNKKLAELNEEELSQVSGGLDRSLDIHTITKNDIDRGGLDLGSGGGGGGAGGAGGGSGAAMSK